MFSNNTFELKQTNAYTEGVNKRGGVALGSHPPQNITQNGGTPGFAGPDTTRGRGGKGGGGGCLISWGGRLFRLGDYVARCKALDWRYLSKALLNVPHEHGREEEGEHGWDEEEGHHLGGAASARGHAYMHTRS